MRKQTDADFIRCECLDLVEAAHRRRVYPLMYCHMELSGRLDVDRLKQAVSLSAKIVPELLCAYDFQRGGFVNAGCTANDVVICGAGQTGAPLRDLDSRPQLRLLLTPCGGHWRVTAVMSHLLADGAGFLQYLYLLSALYNGKQPDGSVRNTRDISPLLEHIRVLAPTEQTRHNRRVPMPPLRPAESGGRPFCLTTRISAGGMAAVRRRARETGATLNDVFLTAYARVVAGAQDVEAVVLPCPADLRKFHPGGCGLTVANMTGIYREITVELPPGRSFTAALQQVHIEMALQRSRCRCFAGIKALNAAFQRVPRAALEQAVKATYRLPPISYTNCGVIDHEQLRFRDCSVRTCFLTGAYRLPPDFQLTVSTFQNACTLNCALTGTAEDAETSQRILDQVKREILTWAERAGE